MSRFVAALAGALGIAAAILAGAAANAPLVYAHAELVSVDPLDGAMLTALPESVELTFSEPVGKPADIVVLGPDRQPLPSGEVSTIDTVASVALDPGIAPAEGWYTISYQVTSADGHLVTGTSTFMVHVSGSTAMPPAPGGAVAGTSTSADPFVVAALAIGAAVLLVVALGAVRRVLVTEP